MKKREFICVYKYVAATRPVLINNDNNKNRIYSHRPRTDLSTIDTSENFCIRLYLLFP